MTPASARASIDTLVEVGVLKELTGKKHGRIYAAAEMLAVLEPKPKSAATVISSSDHENVVVGRN